MTLIIESLPLEALIPYARNSRTHSPEQVAQIAGSIREFGFNNPVLVDPDGGIIAGHGRVMAARTLGMDTVPCIRLGHLTPAQRRAYIITDNKLALNAGWDEEMLKIELQELQAGDFDISHLGFNEQELNLIFNGWESDIDLGAKHGEHLDGITTTIKIKVDQMDSEQAKEVITNALDSHGVSYEFG